MSEEPRFDINRSSVLDVAEHLWECSGSFVPPLAGRVSIEAYAQKILDNAERIELWHRSRLIGLVAIYCNDFQSRTAFITNVSMVPEWQKRGLGLKLVEQAFSHAQALGCNYVKLEVDRRNQPAIALYQKIGFVEGQISNGAVTMSRQI